MAARIPPRAPEALLRLREPDQIALGRRLFERETFGGNGRTCAACHPQSNNFTLDAPFVARLPRRDPLFIAERVPALRGLENDRALREQALILENLDGFDRPGTLRSVMHTFALGLTNAPEGGFPLVHALGWIGPARDRVPVALTGLRRKGCALQKSSHEDGRTAHRIAPPDKADAHDAVSRGAA
jgi:hypothetical protein